MLFPNHLSSSAAGNDLEMCMSSLVLTAKNVLETLTLYRTLSTYRKRFFSPLLFVFFSISAVNSSKSLSLPPTHTSRFKCWWEFWSHTGAVRARLHASQPYHENGAYPFTKIFPGPQNDISINFTMFLHLKQTSSSLQIHVMQVLVKRDSSRSWRGWQFVYSPLTMRKHTNLGEVTNSASVTACVILRREGRLPCPFA